MTRVAIQGITGSYSEEAVREFYGDGATVLECDDFPSTFEALRAGSADKAVVPIENKIVGEIRPAVELLSSAQYRVIDKLPLRVCHVLAGVPGSSFEQTTSVRSHVEALRQCRAFLSRHPELQQEIGADTASSIRRIVEAGDVTRTAIGSRRAAEMYGAEILRTDIADDIDNWTVFYLIGV